MASLPNLDVQRLASEFRRAQPYPHVVIEGFLDPVFAAEVAASYPSYEEAVQRGKGFKTVNEYRKVQVTDYEYFSASARRLADALAAPETLSKVEAVTGVKNLVWDPTFAGGGMHQTARSGILDVHVDFNYLEQFSLYRRLNLLIYLNPVWEEGWGGALELWDRDVKRCERTVQPALGRAVLFETSEISFHGVTEVRCPEGVVRKSFAVYYYTREAPPAYSGQSHGTIFKARPAERRKRYFSMPLEAAERRLSAKFAEIKGRVKSLIRS